MTPVYRIPNSADISEKKQASHLILVDSEVRDADLLTTSLPAGYAVCPVAQGDDGIALLETLMNNAPKSVHVLAHGRSGAVRLGGRWLQLDDFVSAWQNAAGAAGQVSLHFWSCMTGAGSAGKAFVQELSHKIGGIVTAFSGLVGAKALGGSWVPDVCSTDAAPLSAPFAAKDSYAYTLEEVGGSAGDSAIELRKLVMDGQIAIQVWLNPGIAIDSFDLEFSYDTDGGSYTGYEPGVGDWAMEGKEESTGTVLIGGFSSSITLLEGGSDILLCTLYFDVNAEAQNFSIALTANSSLDNSTFEPGPTSVPLGDLPILDFELGHGTVSFDLVSDEQAGDDVLASFEISDQEVGYLYGDEDTGVINRLEVIESWTDDGGQQSDTDVFVIEIAGDGVTFLARQIVQIEIGEWDSENNRPVSLGVGDDGAQVTITWQENIDGVVGSLSFTDNEDGENLPITIELINSGNSTDNEPDIAVVYVSGVKKATYSMTGWREDDSNPTSLVVTAIESSDAEEVFSGILEYETAGDLLPTSLVVPDFRDEDNQDFQIDFDALPAGSAQEGEQFFDFYYDSERAGEQGYVASVTDTTDSVETALYDDNDDGIPDRFIDVKNDNDSGTIEFAENDTVTVTVTQGDSPNLTGRLAFSSDGAVVGMYLAEAEGSSGENLDFNTSGTVLGVTQEGERYYAFTDGGSDAVVLFEDATLRATLSEDGDGDPSTYSVNWEWLDKDGNVTDDESGTWTFEDKDGLAGYESWTMVSGSTDEYPLVADGDDEDTLPDGFIVEDDQGNQVAVEFTWQDRDEDDVVATFTSDEVLGNDGHPITFTGSLIDSDNDGDPDHISGTWDDDAFEGVFSVHDTDSDGTPDSYRVVFSNIRTGRVQLDSAGDPAGVYVNMDEEGVEDEGDQNFQIDFDGSPAGSAEEGEQFFDFYYDDPELSNDYSYIVSVVDTEDGVVTALYDSDDDGVPDRFVDVANDNDSGTIEFAEDGTVTVTVTGGDSSNLTGRLAFSSDGAVVGMYLAEADGDSNDPLPLIPADDEEQPNLLATFTISEDVTGYLYDNEGGDDIIDYLVVKEVGQDETDTDEYTLELSENGSRWTAYKVVEIAVGSWDDQNNRPSQLGVGDNGTQVDIEWQDNGEGVVGTLSYTDNEDGENLSVRVDLINSGSGTALQPDIAKVFVGGIEQATYSLTGWPTDASNPETLTVTALASLDPDEVFSGSLVYDNGTSELPTAITRDSSVDEDDSSSVYPAGSSSEIAANVSLTLPAAMPAVVEEGDPVSDSDALRDQITSFATGGSTMSDEEQEQLVSEIEAYVDGLADPTGVTVRSIALTPETGFNYTDTVSIAGDPASQEALIIDVSDLDPEQVLKLELDDVDFAVIIGAAQVFGGAGENYAVGDGAAQVMVLGADDDTLDGGAGDDVIGSLGGNDSLSGGADNDTVFGGDGDDTIDGGPGDDVLYGEYGVYAGQIVDDGTVADSWDDLLTGGAGNDAIDGEDGVDTAVYSGNKGDYEVTFNEANDTYTIKDLRDGSPDGTDTVTNVEYLQFADETVAAFEYSTSGESLLYLDSSLTDEGIDIEVWLKGGVTIDSADLVFTYAGDGVSFEGGSSTVSGWTLLSNEPESGKIAFSGYSLTPLASADDVLLGTFSFDFNGDGAGFSFSVDESSSLDNSALDPSALDLGELPSFEYGGVADGEATGTLEISGTVEEGGELTASISDLADDDGEVTATTYQWQISDNGTDWTDIDDATSATYTIASDQSQVAKYIRVTAETTDALGGTTTFTSASQHIANVNDAPEGGISIQGTPKQGETLTAVTSALADADGLPATLNYQWYADGDAIADATANTYTLTQSEVGKAIKVKVSYTDDEGTAESVTSAATAAVDNVDDEATGTLEISGTAAEDQVLTAVTTSLADEDGLGDLSYQWYADDVEIDGATASTYTLTQSEVGKAIKVEVSYTDAEGTDESVTSSSTGAVANVNDAPTGSVTISGTAAEDQVLTAVTTNLADEDGLGDLSYQWYADDVEIDGATASTYTLTQSEVGKTITVEVSYTDAEGTDESVTSSSTGAVANVDDQATGTLEISGAVKEGGELTASISDLADDDGAVTGTTYQWEISDDNSSWTAIEGATSATYTIADDQSQVAKYIRVTAETTDALGGTTTFTSASQQVANVNDVPTGNVAITGNVKQGETLTADTSSLADEDGLPATLNYQWYADGDAIADASASTYTLTQSEVGKAIKVKVSYTDDEGTAESVTSAATAAVANVNDAPTGSVTISGTAAEDQVLTAVTTSLADEDGLGDLSYQWYAGTDAISGATASTYTLTQSEVGKAIKVEVSYTDGEGTDESVTSAATAAVANVNDAPTGSVTISGTAAEDQVLTAVTTNLADEDGLGDLSYQWYADDVEIDGATASTYTLTQSEVGKTITVEVSYTDAEGTDESVTSSSTGAVANVDDQATGTLEISGAVKEGGELTASISDLADDDGAVTGTTYQWEISDDNSSWTAIEGATSATYTIADDQSQVDKYIRVTAETTDALGGTTTFTSASQQVANVNDAPTGNVTIEGTVEEGQALTANTDALADEDGLGDLSYQWYADDEAISGATASAYTLTQSEVGKAITVEVSYTDDEGTDESVTSTATATVANVNDEPTGNVTIDGTVTEGETLTANTSTLADEDGLGDLSYQWYADGAAIADATASTYTLTQSEVGKPITVKVSYTDGEGTAESVTSASTVAVLNTNFDPVGTLTITGNLAQGQELTANADLTDPDGIGELNYTWYANGIVISGANQSTYTLTQAEVGKQIRVEVSYTDDEGVYESVKSLPTAKVANVNDAPTGEVVIEGSVTDGGILSANTDTLSDPDGLGELSYQWYADGSEITGATEGTYTLTQSEVDKAITVKVSYIDGEDTAESVTSDPTSNVTNTNTAPTGDVTIDGTVTEGETLTVNTSDLADVDGLTDAQLSYQWKADGTAIVGATASTYTLTQAEVGKEITVVVSYTDAGGTKESVTSAATATVANVDDEATGTLAIRGTVQQGEELSASISELADPDGEVTSTTFQWQMSDDGETWSDIAGATKATYTIEDDQSQVDKYIRVTAETTDELGGTTTFESSATAEVQNVNDDPTGTVTVSGTPEEGALLRAVTAQLDDADGLGAFSYQWYADDAEIAEATASTYTLAQAEVGKVITVKVSYTDAEGTAESVTSAATAAVANVDDEATGTLEISGTVAEGGEVSASLTGVSDADGDVTSTTYQWQTSDDESIWTAIDGATSSAYTLEDDQSQVGKYIRVIAETTDTLGGTTTFESTSQQVENVNDDPTGSVTITGTVKQGKTLTANTDTLADADGLGTLSYQWYADGAEISDATSVIYKLTQEDVGKAITVKASYTDNEGAAESVTSSATEAVQNVNDTPTGSVTITGTVKQGETLTADASTLADADGLPDTLNYQWYADNEVIDGATEESYTLTQDEVGKSITVEVSYTDAQSTDESIMSAATVAVRDSANTNNTPTGTVTVTGTVKQGETLTVDTSTLADADGLPATLNYQWYADGSEITGATSATYDLTQEEVGKVIMVKVSYEDTRGNDEIVMSASTAAVENVDDEATGELEISGTVQEGATLSAGITTPEDEDGEIVLTTYQWQVSDDGETWSDIAGATKATYAIEDDQSQVGKYIRVTAETTDEFGGTTTFDSEATGAVLNVNDDPTGTVTVSGAPEEGTLLRAVTSQLDDADGLGAFSFQWYADGSEITGATSATYTLTQGEVGETITVQVSYTDGEGTAESVTSAATTTVANVDDEATGTLEISGTVEEGAELTASLTDVSDADGDVTNTTYQWQISEDNSTWTDIDGATNGTYTIASDQSHVGSYIRVTVETTDELGGTTILASASSEVQNVNDAPEFLEGDIAPLLIIKDGEAVISSTKLDPTDPDDNPGDLTYSLTTGVSQGTLWLDSNDNQELDAGEELSSSSTFTQADIDADLLFYSNNGDEDDDSFEFEVTDDAGESTGSQTFTITVYGTKIVDNSGVESESATVEAKEIDGDISPDDALTAFTDSLVKNSSAEEREEISEKQDAFLSEAGDDVTVRSIRIEPTGDVAEGEEVYLSVGGSTDGTEALVLDLSAYESGTVVTIDFNDVEFAVVTGAISATGGLGSNILVADGAAQFVVLGEDDDTIDGGAGDDTIGSEGGNDYLIGGPGNDTVFGGADNDTLVGGQDNDILDGESGNDTAVYSGDFDEYEISYNAVTLTYTIKDTEDYRDGTDTVTGVENFEFADGVRTDILAPVVGQGIADRTVQENASVTFSILSTAFDPVDGDALTYAAQLADGSQLPDWLELEGSTFTYSSGDDHQGDYQVTVTATDDSGLSASDTFTLTVSNVNAEPEGAPRIIGTARQNQELSVDASGITDADGLPDTLDYQWYADGDAINGATESTYTLTQAEVGKAIKVVVSYTDDEGTAESVESAATAAVTNVNDDPTGSVTISGTAAEDEVLTADTSTLADEDGLPDTLDYQWYADGDAISGATESTYTLTQDEVGKAITVKVSYTDDEGTDESVTSSKKVYVAGGTAVVAPNVSLTLPDAMPAEVEDGDSVNDGDELLEQIFSFATTASKMSADEQAEVEGRIEAYVDGLADPTGVIVRSIALTSGTGFNYDDIVSIAGDSDSQEALIIDVSGLDPDQVLQLKLDDVDFAVIVGAAQVFGGAGENYAVGDGAAQVMVLGADDDTLDGGAGDDVIGSHGGNDIVFGGTGNDTVFGGDGNDSVDGGAGDDILYGEYDPDNAACDLLSDTTLCNDAATGNDTLKGGAGNDTIYGGPGTDTAVYTGNADDYLITFSEATDTYTIKDLRDGSPDGTDTVSEVEYFMFADSTDDASDYSTLDAAVSSSGGSDSDVGAILIGVGVVGAVVFLL